MSVFANDIAGSSNDGAIHKLIIVRVLGNQMKTELGVNSLSERTFQYGINDVLGNKQIGFPFKDFHVFTDDFIADTQYVSAITKSLPSRAIRTAFWNHAKEAVGVDNYALSHIQRFCR